MTNPGSAHVSEPGPPSPDQSFEATYAETVNLLGFIARVRFRIPPADADALIQDVYLKFARDFAQVRTPRSWLVTAMANTCRNYWRDREREDPYPEDAENWEDPYASGVADSILTRLALGAALRQIGERCRTLLYRFHIDGDSSQTIAESTGTTSGYVHVLLHQCRKRARALYTELTKVAR